MKFIYHILGTYPLSQSRLSKANFEKLILNGNIPKLGLKAPPFQGLGVSEVRKSLFSKRLFQTDESVND